MPMMNKTLPILDPRIPSWDMSRLVKRNCPTCHGDKVGQSLTRPDQLSVLECAHCETFYVSPAPDDDSLDRFYGQYHQEYFAASLPKPTPAQSHSKKFSFLTKKWQTTDLRLARMTQYLSLDGKRVLDVGCGRGRLMGLMLSLGAQVYGVDPDQGAVDYARASGFLNVWQGGVNVVEPSLRFDLITISDVLEHPLNPGKLLSECADRLNPGGLIMIWTPNADHVKKDPERVMFRIHLEHMQYFSETSLRTLCKQINLDMLHTEVHGHPYLGTVHQLTGKRQYFQRFRQLFHTGLNLAVIRWPWVFRNSLLGRIRGSYSLLAILQRVS